MSATTIFFNGRVISVPGSYTEVDASGLEVVGLGASGIVALLGTAIGGKPWTDVDTGDVKGYLQVATRPAQPFTFFREGDLREAAAFTFGPSQDADVPGGAQEVVFVKVNPAEKSSAAFSNPAGEALVLTSRDWGFFTTQIAVEIGNGTNKGKLITVTFENTEEVFDDVGGDDIFDLQYLASIPAEGFTTIQGQIASSAVSFTLPNVGLDSAITNPVVAGQVIELVSSSAADTAVVVRLFGTDASNAAQYVDKTLNGLTFVATTQTWNEFHGAVVISGVLIGTLTIRNAGAGTTITTIAPAGTQSAVAYKSQRVAGSTVNYVVDGASTARVTIYGLGASGSFQIETVPLTGVVAVAGSLRWNRIDGMALGRLAAARTLTVSGVSLRPAVVADFTRAQIGLDSEVTNPVVAGQAIELLSSSAADAGVQVRLLGVDDTNQPQTAVVTLTGTVVVTTTQLWNSFHGAVVVFGTLVGTLTIRNAPAGTTIATIAPAATEAAVEYTLDHAAAGAITYVASGATTARVTVYGLSTSGVWAMETVQLNGTTIVGGLVSWSRIDGLALGALAAARTLTISGRSVQADFAGLETIQKMADKFNGTVGYTFTVAITNPASYLSASLDSAAPTDIKSPADLTASGDLQAIIDKLNGECSLVEAARGSVGSGPPTNTVAPVFLAGGHEGSTTPGQEGVPTATAADWQGAINLLTKVRINTLVPLTGDPAIHAMARAHAEYMGGIGRSERDVVIGLQNAALTDVPTKAELKTQIVDLNSRHVRAVAQAIERYDSFGERTEFQPPFQAAIVAGMQAGSPVATSLTHKFANVLKLRQSSTWNPADDSEELIQAGLHFMEVVDGVGRRVVRNITTHLSSSNIAYTEASVNEAVNYAVYDFRTTMERMVGKRGFSGTVNGAKGLAVNILGLLVGVALTAYRSLDIQLILDVLEVSVEISPVLPINFVQSTIHLVAIPQSASAA